MHIRQADAGDIGGLARLLAWNHTQQEPTGTDMEAFAADLAEWWRVHEASHVAYVAADPDAGLVDMAWVALLPRVPRPGMLDRLSADVQSVFVLPDARGAGIGSLLVDAATRHAEGLGATRVTVHSSGRAIAVYERLGFASSPKLLQRPAE